MQSRSASSASDSRSLSDFIAQITPAHWPIPVHLHPLIALLQRASREPVRALLSMPPRHAKTVTALSALAWMVQQQPHKLNAYVTYAQRLANSHSRQIRWHAQEARVALADDATAVHEWRTPQGGGLISTGVGGPLTGIGISGICLLDDVLKNREEAESVVTRESVYEWFTNVAFTRLEPGASCICIATRWHADDLIGRLEAQRDPRWEVINLPGEGSDGQALWPERFPVSALKAIRSQIGEYAWASLYQGHPVPRSGRLFHVPTRYEDLSLTDARVVAFVDPAGSESTHADYTAAVCLAVRGYDDKTTADVIEVLRGQWDGNHAVRHLEDFQRRRGLDAIAIEASRDGKSIAKAWRSMNPRLIITEVPPRGDKYTRAQPVAAAWNQGRVRVPEHAPWLPDFLEETGRFTGISDTHDDQIDALSGAFNLAVNAAVLGPPILIGQERGAGW